jgi:hypothetical protein
MKKLSHRKALTCGGKVPTLLLFMLSVSEMLMELKVGFNGRNKLCASFCMMGGTHTAKICNILKLDRATNCVKNNYPLHSSQ